MQGSRYAERLPIGTPEVIKGAPRERMLAFYKKWYRPDQMAVIVVGDIDPAAAEKLVRARFEGIPKPSEPAGTRGPDDSAAQGDALQPGDRSGGTGLDRDAQLQEPGAEQTTVGDYRAALVRQLVGEMLNPRLREIARRPNAPFIGAEAGADTFGRTLQLFEIGAAVPENGLAPGLEAVMLEARRVQQFGFSADGARSRPGARCWPPTSAPTTSAGPPRARATPASTSVTSSKASRSPVSSSNTASRPAICRP